jgi:hypothetical protein
LQWTLAEMEKPLHLMTKVFLMNFPLYVAVKQYPHYKTEEVTQQEVSAMNHYSRNRYAIITFKNCQYVLPVHYLI